MHHNPDHPIAPGSTIGIIGGGQLGRMTALAAAEMGYATHILCPEERCPASLVAAGHIVAAYDDRAALEAFAEAVDVITFEFENIPHESVQLLADHALVRPGWKCLQIAQDRLEEKKFLNRSGAPTAPYRAVRSAADLAQAVAEIGLPAVLKTVRFGYDGKGQVVIKPGDDLDQAWSSMGADLGVLEGFIDFQCEISVIIARNPKGELACFDPVENQHANHILDITIAPAPIAQSISQKAMLTAERVANALDLIGLLAVEMFVTKSGELLVNEIAPRPHNSGHWTMDACVTSQFEQFVRAVCGLPLGSATRHSDAVMKNLIGPDVNAWHQHLTEPNTRLHLYGKREARPGRKMGHVTRLKQLTG